MKEKSEVKIEVDLINDELSQLDLNEKDKCVQSLNSGEDEDDGVEYRTKAPIRRGDGKKSHNATPYDKKNQLEDLTELNMLKLLEDTGLVLEGDEEEEEDEEEEQGERSHHSPKMGNEEEEEEGIPGLPKQSKGGVNQILMNSIDVIFGKQVSSSRIVFKARKGENPLTTVHTPLKFVVDIENKRIGIQIPRQIIPNHVVESSVDGRIEIYIQLDSNLKRVIKYTASVETVKDPVTGNTTSYVKDQFMTLKPLKENSGLSILLDGLSETDIQSAVNLINSKDIAELFKTYGPNDDTLISMVCFSKDENPSTRARALALTKKILEHPEAEKRANIIKKNKCDISPLEFAATTNKVHIAPYIAELYYDIGEDIHCRDDKGNTLLHVMARKGDVVAPTLKSLLDLTFNNGNKVYPTDMTNQKGQLPIHIASLGNKCSPQTIQFLYQSNPSCMRTRECNGSMPIHMACQFSTDPTMLATLLHYDPYVINEIRNDGLTPLHLVASRSTINDSQAGIVPLDEDSQIKMIRHLLQHGADRNIRVQGFTPFSLVAVDRLKVKILLKTRRETNGSTNNEGGNTSGGSGNNSPSLCGSPIMMNKFIQSPGGSTTSNSSGFGGKGGMISPQGYNNNRVSPNSYMNPHSHCSDLDGNRYSNITPTPQVTNEFSPLSSHDRNGAGSDHNTEEDPENLDAIAQVLYHHPSIQAAVMMASDQS